MGDEHFETNPYGHFSPEETEKMERLQDEWYLKRDYIEQKALDNPEKLTLEEIKGILDYVGDEYYWKQVAYEMLRRLSKPHYDLYKSIQTIKGPGLNSKAWEPPEHRPKCSYCDQLADVGDHRGNYCELHIPGL